MGSCTDAFMNSGAILDRMVSAAIKIIATFGRFYRREVMGRRSTASDASPASTNSTNGVPREGGDYDGP